MAVRVRHSSPDGSLVLVVDGTDGDLAVRFEGYEWHTHGDLFVGSYGPRRPRRSPRLSTRFFPIAWRSPSAVATEQSVTSVSPTIQRRMGMQRRANTYCLRFWSVRAWHAS